MPTPNLLVICGTAFLVVFVVLAILAAVMRGLMLVFPQPEEPGAGIDPAVVAAITEAVTSAYPGTKVSGIEEVR
jgi:hypothetical protein